MSFYKYLLSERSYILNRYFLYFVDNKVILIRFGSCENMLFTIGKYPLRQMFYIKNTLVLIFLVVKIITSVK